MGWSVPIQQNCHVRALRIRKKYQYTNIRNLYDKNKIFNIFMLYDKYTSLKNGDSDIVLGWKSSIFVKKK